MFGGRNKVINLLSHVAATSCRCPTHNYSSKLVHTGGTANDTDYAFEMATSNIRYGFGVSGELGMDLVNLNAKNVGVFTDKNVAKLPSVKTVLDSMIKEGVNFEVFDDVRVEPTDTSFTLASNFAKARSFDVFVAIGGGSVIDTAKAANLFSSDPEAELLDYVNRPVGKGKPVRVPLKPMIAIPTTSGTGSETTGIAVFDYEPLNAKVGIANRALRPTLGLIDPLHALHMPERVAAFCGFDVLCHALESYTAIGYTSRSPRPSNPLDRPAYQGSNPISDVWARHSLKSISKYFERSVNYREDQEARANMHLAATFAGIGFGNAGVHLCHGLSYSIAGMVKSYQPDHYGHEHPIIPHGLSVVITAPAVFEFTAPMCPERHLEGASLLGSDVSSKTHRADAGRILSDALRGYMQRLNIPDGLGALGYAKEDIAGLVRGALPQDRVNRLAPRPQTEKDFYDLYENALKVY